MAAAVVFHQFSEDVAHGVHNLGSDTLKLALTNSAPSTSNEVFGSITEIAAGNGYTAGGATITVTSSGQTAGVYKLIVQEVTITASGGSIGPFRYAVIYNSTPTSPLKPLIQYYDYGSAVTLSDGSVFPVDFDGSLGCLKISIV